jgi:ABC-type polysaccharide/polyol phosphate transport system ATPase subunit
MTTVTHALDLSRSYYRGMLRPTTLREHLIHALKSPLSVFRSAKAETFWVINDVSLEVYDGDMLGLIGRNEAGRHKAGCK